MKNISIGTKLIAGTLALILLLCLSGLAALIGLGALRDELNGITDRTARQMELAGAMNKTQALMLSGQRRMTLFAARKDLAAVDEERNRFKNLTASIERNLEEVRPLLVTSEGQEIVKRIAANLDAWQPEFDHILGFCREGKSDEAFQWAIDRTVPISTALDKDLDRLVAISNELLALDKVHAAAAYSRSRNIAFMLMALSLVVGVVMGYIMRRINHELRRAAIELEEGSKQIAGAAAQVSAASQSLAQSANEQAASIQETSASAEEISTITSQNTDRSKKVTEMMSEAIPIVNAVNTAHKQLGLAISEVGTSSEKVSKVIKMIDEIAFQTNILALNAAVEAARAGESGMGFAVVADEVRNLAQRSANAAKETATLVEESVLRSREGARKLDEVLKAMEANNQIAGAVKGETDEIGVASEEQARGIVQISTAISQMSQLTQSTAAQAQESAAAAEELNAQSEALNAIVRRLTSMLGGAEPY